MKVSDVSTSIQTHYLPQESEVALVMQVTTVSVYVHAVRLEVLHDATETTEFEAESRTESRS